jgi:hypothetical protein
MLIRKESLFVYTRGPIFLGLPETGKPPLPVRQEMRSSGFTVLYMYEKEYYWRAGAGGKSTGTCVIPCR